MTPNPTAPSDPLAALRGRGAPLRSALDEALKHPHVFGQVFYQRLFELAPAARTLFPADLSDQQQKFARTLAAIIEAVTGPSAHELPQHLRQLGARHLRYGANAVHYAAVGQALGDSLRAAAPERFDDVVLGDWQRCYAWIALTMIQGASAGAGAAAATAHAHP